MWVPPPERNHTGIQFEELRGMVDGKFNQVHDELSACFYDKKPFRTYGVLSKAQFDKLHGLIFLLREVEFNETNLASSVESRIPESEYNDRTDAEGKVIAKSSDLAAAEISVLKAQGFELEIGSVKVDR